MWRLTASRAVVVIGQSLMNAYYKMETVEHFAKITLVARQIGNENVFSPERAQELMDARARYGVIASGACRIETRETNPKVSYAPEVPQTGFGAAAYAGDASAKSGEEKARSNGKSSNGDIEINEGELQDLVREVTRRVLSGLQK